MLHNLKEASELGGQAGSSPITSNTASDLGQLVGTIASNLQQTGDVPSDLVAAFNTLSSALTGSNGQLLTGTQVQSAVAAFTQAAANDGINMDFGSGSVSITPSLPTTTPSSPGGLPGLGGIPENLLDQILRSLLDVI